MSNQDLVFAPVDWIDHDVGPAVDGAAMTAGTRNSETDTGGGGKGGGGKGKGGGGKGKGRGGPAPGTGAQRVPVAPVLQVIKGTFIDPRTGKSTPLPSHQWEI